MSPNRQSITPEIVKKIQALHKKHPNLGQKVLSKLLAAEGIHLDAHELRVFLETRRMQPGPTAGWGNSADPLSAYRGGGRSK